MLFGPFRRRLALVTSAALTSVLWWGVPPAHAAFTSTDSCSAGYFTGFIRVTTEQSFSVPTKVLRIEYRIVRNGSGGNKANVNWADYAVAPTKTAGTGNGIQDGSWHTLLEQDYNRGSGNATFKFDFDKSGSDPECGETFL